MIYLVISYLLSSQQLTNSTAKQLNNSHTISSLILLLRTMKVYSGYLCMSVGSKLRQSQIANRCKHLDNVDNEL
jgi:hypothetical protein